MPECLSPQAVSDLANKDVSRLVGDVGRFTLQTEPYTSLFGTGSLPNVSDVVRSVVAERALPGSSLTRPVFTNSTAACAMPGLVTQVGSTEFSFQMQMLRERGPKFCAMQQRSAFPGSYESLINSLKQSIREVIGADNRATLLDSGGFKFTADSTGTFANSTSGDINTVGAQFSTRVPDSPISARGLEILGTYMREVLDVDPHEGDGDEGSLMAIFGQDQIQLIRDELDIREDVRALTTGRYKMGEDTISGYKFKGPYHGIAYGIDRRPLRANTLVTVANGGVDARTGIVNAGAAYIYPVLLDPYTATAVTKGTAARPSATWNAATYEIGFLVGKNPFKRLTPESHKIAGMDFPLPISNEGLKFKLLDDSDCNFWNDFGQHKYQLERAFQPIVPHAACAILFKRCSGANGLISC